MAGGLLTRQQEDFCRLYVEGVSAGPAYDQSHPGSRKPEIATQKASRLLARAEIKARIAEIRNMAAEKTATTIQDIARQLDEDRRFAYEEKKPSAAVAASVAKAKLLGLYVEKKDIQLSMRPEEARSIIELARERIAKSSR